MRASPTAATRLDSFLTQERERSSLRFITCGSVDDGKSTLIGRLLYESKLLFDDQIAALEADSRRAGNRAGGLDFSLLVDGLAAEREQGITIDVAHRFFATSRRKFIVADTPGHEQYTRNMATGASLSELAIILVDARKGLLTQTRRHSVIVSMLGVRHVVLAVNKIDLVGYAQTVFDDIARQFRAFAEPLAFTDIRCIPISALQGDNVVSASPHTPWYGGPPLLDHLESVEVENDSLERPFRMPVQWVNRPSGDFRGYAGLIASGAVYPGERVRAALSGREARVARIATYDGDIEAAGAGRSVSLVLDREIDIPRGDLLCAATEPADVSTDLAARVLWIGEQALVPGRAYLLRIGTRTVSATVQRPDYVLDINTLAHKSGETLHTNETGQCRIALDQPVAFDAYARNRETGAFILIDRDSNDTVALGFAERGAGKADLPPPPSLDRPLSLAEPLSLAAARSSRPGPPFVQATTESPRPPPSVSRQIGEAATRHALAATVTFVVAYAFTMDWIVAASIAGAHRAAETVILDSYERRRRSRHGPPEAA